MVLLGVVEVVFVLGQPTSTLRKVISEVTGITGGLFHLRVIAQHPPWCHNPVRIINLVLWVVIP